MCINPWNQNYFKSLSDVSVCMLQLKNNQLEKVIGKNSP